MKMKLYRLLCKWTVFWLPRRLNDYQREWQKIDHRKDKSLSAYDFRFWVYLREMNRKRKLFNQIFR